MRTRIWATTAAAGCLLLTTAGTAAAASADDSKPARTVEWSVGLESATAAGERWTEPRSTGFSSDLVLSGTLSNTGQGCYSVWTKFTFDFISGPIRKHAEICGPGNVEVNVRQAYQLTTTGSLTVCKGISDTKECAPWENITWWPINQG
jgi:hypothetical protein